MKHIRMSAIAAFAGAVVAAGCGAGSERPGAELRTPGALAPFYGFVASKDGLRHLLAVANERGDELRLVDLADDSVIDSPGLVYPLSVPTTGRPLQLAAARLQDGLPDALAVIVAGSNDGTALNQPAIVEVVDTWSGNPTFLDALKVTLPADAEVLSMTAAAAPLAVPPAPPLPPGSPAPGIGRILVGLSGGRLAVLDFSRGAGNAVAAPVVTVLTGLGFDIVSLSQGADARHVFAASRDPLPTGVFGVAQIALPQDLTGWIATTPGTVTPLDALAPTEAVAAAAFADWSFPAADSFTDLPNLVERVFTVPVASECGAGKAVRCGLLALDPNSTWGGATLGNLLPNLVVGEEAYRLPVTLPAPVSGLLAAGRTAEALIPVVSAGGAITISTTGVAAVTTTDGNLYLVDLARGAMASDTSPLVGTGKTRVTTATATVVDVKSSTIGLWKLVGTTPTLALSAKMADVPARVLVTPGFTPDDNWSLTWQGVLPGLDTRGALLGQDAGGFWLSAQVGTTTTPPILSAANLASLGVAVGDTVTLFQTGIPCADGFDFTITGLIPSDSGRPGGAVSLADTAGNCLATSGPILNASVPAVATFRAGGLVLTGDKFGHAGRPAAFAVEPLATDEFKFAGNRLFYVTDPCTSVDCVATWKSAPYLDASNALAFPLPKGPVLGFVPGFVDPKTLSTTNLPTTVVPTRGTALHFTTASGLVPSARRPIVSGAAVANMLPLGLALIDPGGGGVQLLVSYAAGLVADYRSDVAPGTMTVVR